MLFVFSRGPAVRVDRKCVVIVWKMVALECRFVYLQLGGRNTAVVRSDLQKHLKKEEARVELGAFAFMHDPQCGVLKGIHKLRLKPLNHPSDSGEIWERRVRLQTWGEGAGAASMLSV